MKWSRVRDEWRFALMTASRPSVLGSAFVWLLLQVAVNATNGNVRSALLLVSAIPAVIFGKGFATNHK